MRSIGMVPVFYHADACIAKEVLDACYRGGVRVFEFTNRGDKAPQVFKDLLRHAEQYPDLIMGIGTILNAATTQQFIDAGAHFIVSPVLKPEMATVCARYDKLWIPGCATLTEIVNARELGAQIIKLFPGSVLGPDFVSSVLPVMPDLQLMPTGGVEPTEENLTRWFKAGVTCVGMGSKLMVKSNNGNYDLNAIEQVVRESINIITRCRQK
ncbi:MAG: bifunctional 4-hydroxy-2-oxoglutarate aldolase/2-dehydro-3-deoxy-phosphogluconate aldolase [Cyclobacteriaceae bacterium]|nr:MAG: bifunctional 4-hydroxy-2-oxoglutarate aldolase/2-dehydro-3-deoxy-phosphogluconate aldolase [Cyclobacteriaceae bacterium]